MYAYLKDSYTSILRPHIPVGDTVRMQVTDGEVYAVRIVKAGSGCKASARHTLEASCPSRTACQRPEAASQLMAVAEVKNGAVVRVSVLAEGRGYLNKPLLKMPVSAECSEAPVLLATMLTECSPDRNGARSVLIKGILRPLFIPRTFPGEGLVFRPAADPQRRLQPDAQTRLHDAAVVSVTQLSSGTNSQASVNRVLIFIEP